MRLFRTTCLLTVLSLSVGAQNISKLPNWAKAHATEALTATPPADADAWVLLDRTEMAYAGSGTVRVKHFRLTKVLSEQGLGVGTFQIDGLGGRTSQVKRLKGWNARPDGEIKTLESDDIVSLEGLQSVAGGEFSSGIITRAFLPMVVKGSLVAFESEQVFRNPMGPVDGASIMEKHPVRQWEMSLAKQDGWFKDLHSVRMDLDLLHASPWLKGTQLIKGQSLLVKDIPALPKDERATPHARNVYPWVLVRFHDPDLKDMPGNDSWDELATWGQGQFQSRFIPTKTIDTTGKTTLEALRSMHQWMGRELTYKMVYLSPERGWIPEPTHETIRKRYGDCKDLTACFLGLVKTLNLKVYPVWARIIEGEIESNDPVNPYAFNHVISAIQLDQSLGLSSEVETPQGRFLLVDPTDKFTPLGFLPEAHRGHRVMICLERQAVWVPVPDRSIQRNATTLGLTGQAHSDGHLSGTMILKASGGASVEFRSAFLEADPVKLRRVLPSWLGIDITPDAPFEVVRHSDPLELDTPFELEVRFTTSLAYRAGHECTLDLPGMPTVGPVLQAPGKTRKSAIQIRNNSHLEFTASISVPSKLEPVMPVLNQDTPFRTLAWTVLAAPTTAGSTVQVSLTMDRKDCDFDVEKLPEGLVAWKKDRLLIKSLREDGLAFRRIN